MSPRFKIVWKISILLQWKDKLQWRIWNMWSKLWESWRKHPRMDQNSISTRMISKKNVAYWPAWSRIKFNSLLWILNFSGTVFHIWFSKHSTVSQIWQISFWNNKFNNLDRTKWMLNWKIWCSIKIVKFKETTNSSISTDF